MIALLEVPFVAQNADQREKLVNAAVSLYEAQIISLEQTAQLAGLSSSAFVKARARNAILEPVRSHPGMGGEAERFQKWADNHRPDLPVIPLDAMSRERLYY